MNRLTATFVYTPALCMCAQEYEGRLLLTVRGDPGLSVTFQLEPDDALKFADALTKHANALKAVALEA